MGATLCERASEANVLKHDGVPVTHPALLPAIPLACPPFSPAEGSVVEEGM